MAFLRQLFPLLRWLVLLIFIASFGVLLSVFPQDPQTLIGWMGFIALALPMVLLGDFVSDMLWGNRLAQAIERRTAHQTLSLYRIGYGLAVTLCVLVPAFSLGVFLALKVD